MHAAYPMALTRSDVTYFNLLNKASLYCTISQFCKFSKIEMTSLTSPQAFQCKIITYFPVFKITQGFLNCAWKTQTCFSN